MKISNWNNIPSIENAVILPFSDNLPENECCIRGNGRSYGDASLDQTMISILENKSRLEIENDVLIVSSGFLLRDILKFCLANSFIFPVIPGTSYVSVGGMVAADVHGKNHKKNGSIGQWIVKLELRNEENKIVICSAHENIDLFRATIGGMGQTGIIETAHIQLEKWTNSSLKQSVSKQISLSELLTSLRGSQADYQVGWMDFLNNSKVLFFEYNWHLTEEKTNFEIDEPILTFPKLPFSLLSNALMKLYNKRYYKKNLRNSELTVTPATCFFPLDKIGKWNRIYGPKGFYQYQCIFPQELADEAIYALSQKIRKSTFRPYLAVVKVHGANVSPGILSFPMEGISIALDFRNEPGIVEFISELDELVVQYKGRVYLAKDALLSKLNFQKMYPQHKEFETIKSKFGKGYFTSLLAKRLFLEK